MTQDRGIRATPTKFHGPAWEAYGDDGREYIVWAPREAGTYTSADGAEHRREPRSHWQAAWSADRGTKGDVRKGSTLTEVLTLFAPKVAEAFSVEIYEHYAGWTTYVWGPLGQLVEGESA